MKKINIKEVEENVIFDKKILANIKDLKPNLQSLDMNVDIGTEDVILTSAITCACAVLLSALLPHIVKPKYRTNIRYNINPLYKNKNLFNLTFSCIIHVKMVHIMNIIYIYLQKRREEKYERTSNRRAYAHSYE